jgi:hypothetical protein
MVRIQPIGNPQKNRLDDEARRTVCEPNRLDSVCNLLAGEGA